MAKFVDFLKARSAEIENPKHAAMLDVLIEHATAEVRDLDIDRTMATLAGDCVYHHYGDQTAVRAAGMPRVLQGSDEVRAHYLHGMESGTLRMDSLEVEVEHFFISDDAIAWDGFVRARVPGSALVAAGAPLPGGGTAEDDYVHRIRTAIVIPFRDGLMLGEDYYFDGQPTIEKLAS
jgi:hypothetical protein